MYERVRPCTFLSPVPLVSSIPQERRSGTPTGQAGGGLTLVATNEYGEFDRKALALYGLEMVVEPFRETRITASNLAGASLGGRFSWLLVRADQSGSPLEGVDAQVDARAGPFATVTLTDAGEKYALLVQQTRADGTVVAERRVTITCKYVRRELRDLTQADRTGYFSAVREFYTVPLEEGRAKYGASFYNAGHVTAYHNSRVRTGNAMGFRTGAERVWYSKDHVSPAAAAAAARRTLVCSFCLYVITRPPPTAVGICLQSWKFSSYLNLSHNAVNGGMPRRACW